ncbi:MAG TPA: hypothetical protein EYN79_09665 [Planctomycetes bacterium]|nr:hypothetical protein [Planctomycetota bacterium]
MDRKDIFQEAHTSSRIGHDEMRLLTLLLALFIFTGPLPGQSILTVTDGSGAQGSSTSLSILLDNGDGEVQGWSFGACHDTAALTLETIELGSTAAIVNNGDEPAFLALNTEIGGFTMGVVINLFGAATLPLGADYELVRPSYQILGAAGSSTTVDLCSTLGSPPVSITIVVEGSSLAPATESGTMTTVTAVSFIRSDSNGDGYTDLADGIWTLRYLFLGGVVPPCVDSADFNGSGAVDTADAVGTFLYLLLEGPAPSAPFPGCGNVGLPQDCAVSNCP